MIKSKIWVDWMAVILSIKPKYVKEIMEGKKKYELRKKIFKKNVSRVYIYESSPTKKIVASFKIGKIIENDPITLWKKLNPHLGIDEQEYLEYFQNCEKAYAIEITNLRSIEPLEPTTAIQDFCAPQSFSYCSLVL